MQTQYEDFIWTDSENASSAIPLQTVADAMLGDSCMAILYHDGEGNIEALRGTAEALLVFKSWCYIGKKLFCVVKCADKPTSERLIVVDAELSDELILLHSARFATDKNGADKEFFRWYAHHSRMEKALGRDKAWDENEPRYLLIHSVDSEMRPNGNPRLIRMDELDECHHGYGMYKGETVYISNWGTKSYCEERLSVENAVKRHKEKV